MNHKINVKTVLELSIITLIVPVIKIVPSKLILRIVIILMNYSVAEQSYRKNLIVRICKLAIAIAIEGLENNELFPHFTWGSSCSHSYIELSNLNIEYCTYTKYEHTIIKKSKEVLLKKMDIKSLLIVMLYIYPYEFDEGLKLFSEAMDNLNLMPIYINYIFKENQYYTRLNESMVHLRHAELVINKILELYANKDAEYCIKLSSFVEYYAKTNIPLSGFSNQKEYQYLKNLLLVEWLKVKRPVLAGLKVESINLPKSEIKKIGLIRFSMDVTAEANQVFSSLGIPPDGFEIFVFVFDFDKKYIDLASKMPWLDKKIVVLDINDLHKSLTLIREYELDVLINTSPLTGRFINEISILLSLRASKIQAMFVSDVITSGNPSVDFFLMPSNFYFDDIQTQFTEKVITMEGLFGEIVINEEFNRNEPFINKDNFDKEVLFGSNAHIGKISPHVLHAWIRILASTEKSRLVLMPFPTKNSKIYRKKLEKSILKICSEMDVNPMRINICEVSGSNEVCQVLQTTDIYLDSFPYAGSISIFDVLSVGVPIVTLKGSLYRNRFASGILEELGIAKNMVANSEDEYFEYSIGLAKNHLLRASIGREIREAIIKKHRKCEVTSNSDEFYLMINKIIN
jgi:hypothetical protein